MAETPPVTVPHVPVAVVPTTDGFDPVTSVWPQRRPITVIDLVGPGAANRQPVVLDKRAETLRDRINKLIEGWNRVTGRDADGTQTTGDGNPVWFARDGSMQWIGPTAPDFGGFQLTNVAAGLNATDAVNVAQLTALSPDISYFLRHDGGNKWTGPNPLTMSPNGGINRYRITELADGLSANDAVNLGQLQAATAGVQSGTLVDYKQGVFNASTAPTDPTFTLAMDEDSASVYVGHANIFLRRSGDGSEEHAVINFRFDLGTGLLTGGAYLGVTNSANTPASSFSVTLPTNGTKTVVLDLNASTGDPQYLAIEAAYVPVVGAADQLRFFVWVYNNAGTRAAVHNLAGIWHALGFSGFGDSQQAAAVAGLKFVPYSGTTDGSSNLVSTTSVSGSPRVFSFDLTKFVGLDVSRVTMVLLNIRIRVSGATTAPGTRVTATLGSNEVLLAALRGVDSDDHVETAVTVQVPVESSDPLVRLTATLANVPTDQVDVTVVGFLITKQLVPSAPVTSGVGGGSPIGAYLLNAPQYLNPGGVNWDEMAPGTTVTMLADGTRPNETAVLQVDLYLSGPDINPNDIRFPLFQVKNSDGFVRDLTVAAAGGNDRVAVSQMVYGRTDGSGSIQFLVTERGVAIPAGALWRVALLGWAGNAPNFGTYRSAWLPFDVSGGGPGIAFTLTHGLGSLPDFVQVFVRYETSPGVYRTVMVDRTESSGGDDEGASVTDLTTTQLTVRISRRHLSWIDEPTTNEAFIEQGQLRVVASVLGA